MENYMHHTLAKFIVASSAIFAITAVSACTQLQSASSPPSISTPSSSIQPTASSTPPRTGAPPATGSRPSSTQPNLGFTNLPSSVKGGGTISYALDSNLSFDVAGKISKLYVKKGDRVSKGQLLGKLDTTSLGVAVAQAAVNLDQAIIAQTSANLALQTAKFNLDKTQSVAKIKDVITNLEWQVKIAQMNADGAGATDNSPLFWGLTAAQYRKDLAAENKILTDMLSGAVYTGVITYDIVGQPFDRLTVEDMAMKQTQIDLAQQTLDKSQDTIDQAQRNLAQAQKQFDSTTLSAPFDGIVVTLNVKEGDVVSTPSPSQKPAMYLVDPTSLQIVVTINELDTPKLKIGQKATVKVDAFPGVAIDGRVSDISLLPNVQGGVVNYDVTISFNVPPTSDIRSGMNASAEILPGQ
jgi:multidrug resistance efflux pump